MRRALSVALLVVASATVVPSQSDGIAKKRPVFAGACRICPWGAVGDVVKAALLPYGYDVQICSTCNNVRYVADKQMGRPLDQALKDTPYIPLVQRHPMPSIAPEFGATSTQNLWRAYKGTGNDPGPKDLRLLANLQAPNYVIVAAKASSGITDLKDLKNRKGPLHVISGGGEGTAVLAYYGLSAEAIKAGGGWVGGGSMGSPAERRDFDVIIHGGSLGNAPEFNVWYEVSQRFDLKYFQLPDDLIAQLVTQFDMERGAIPNGLLRGIDHPIPTAVRTGHSIFGLAAMPDDFAYVVAKAMDEQQALLQWSHLNLSYNVRNVWKAFDVPLHPGAARYYRERGYLK